MGGRTTGWLPKGKYNRLCERREGREWKRWKSKSGWKHRLGVNGSALADWVLRVRARCGDWTTPKVLLYTTHIHTPTSRSSAGSISPLHMYTDRGLPGLVDGQSYEDKLRLIRCNR
jgi:hypothetical protein